jgi:hypothetical protein
VQGPMAGRCLAPWKAWKKGIISSFMVFKSAPGCRKSRILAGLISPNVKGLLVFTKYNVSMFWTEMRVRMSDLPL